MLRTSCLIQGDFHCPRGCFSSSEAPYCSGDPGSPCRVEKREAAPSRGNGILNRLGSKGGAAVEVNNIPPDVSEGDVVELFSTVGRVLSARMRGAGKVTVYFSQAAEAEKAKAEFHHRTLDGTPMEVVVVASRQSGGVDAASSSESTPSASLDRSPPPRASDIPVFASPILMFNKKTGAKYAAGEAPKSSALFFPSLTSARWVDPHTDIFLILNFKPHPDDQAELDRLRITILDADECLAHKAVRQDYAAFNEACPIGGGALGGSGIIGVTRFFILQGAMEKLGFDMIFFLEGDNLLLRPVSFMAEAYQIRELGIDATITHISFHASFFSIDFIRQLNLQAKLFAAFTSKWLTGQCFLTGGGQDMRLG